MINLDIDIDVEDMLMEVTIHQQLSEHDYIIDIVDHYIEEKMLYIVTEYAKRKYICVYIYIYIEGDLASRLKNTNSLSDIYIMDVMIGIAKGVNYIHSQNIVHMDLKPANIFLTENGIPKIGDFGISKVLNQDYVLSADVRWIYIYIYVYI